MDKKAESAQIKWARRMEKYIVAIRGDKLKGDDVENLLDDLNLLSKSFIINDRVKRYCVSKKAYLLDTLKSSYKSQEAIARNLDCLTVEISLSPSDESRDFKYALWTDDLTVPEKVAGENEVEEAEFGDDAEEELDDVFGYTLESEYEEEVDEETDDLDDYFSDGYKDSGDDFDYDDEDEDGYDYDSDEDDYGDELE